MRLRSTLTVALATLCMLLFAPFLGSSVAGAYPVTTCSALGVSTTNPLPGDSITVTGSNFRPDASVSLVLNPGGTALTTVTTDGSGSFSTQVTLPDSTTNGGNFDIVATSGMVSSTSCPADPIQTLGIQAETDQNGGSNSGSGSGTGGLSVTGLDVAGLLAIAAGLIATGLLLNRKRTKAGSR